VPEFGEHPPERHAMRHLIPGDLAHLLDLGGIHERAPVPLVGQESRKLSGVGSLQDRDQIPERRHSTLVSSIRAASPDGNLWYIGT
jgi:hypothetical protein